MCDKDRLLDFLSVIHSRYYVKLGLYYVSLNVVALASIPFSLLRPARVENMVLSARVMRWVSRGLGISFEVRNREEMQDATHFQGILQGDPSPGKPGLG